MALKKLSKRVFLNELLKGKGVAVICKEYGLKSTGTPYSWRKRDEEFRKEWDKIMESPFHKTRIAATQTPTNSDHGWRERFIVKMRETNDRVAAADFAGKTVSEIMEASDSASENYDKEFANMLYEEELRDAVRIEDEVRRKALIGNSSQMQKYLLPFLPVVGEKYAKSNGKAATGGTNIFVFSPQSMDAAQNQLKDVFGTKSIPASVKG